MGDSTVDLLDRYLNSVRSYLPREQQDDILDELSANIRARMDDREEQLGRPLTADEQEAILQGYGHPMLVAGRYRTNMGSVAFGRQIIGPALFPFYVRALKFVLGASLAIYLVVVVALTVTGNGMTFGDVLGTVALQVVIQFTIITLIFAGVERSLPTLRWSAEAAPKARTAAPARPQVSRLESLGQLVAVVVVAAWLWALYGQPTLFFGSIAQAYHLGPIWGQVALPTLLIFAFSAAQAVVNLVRPDWTLLPPAVRLLTDLGALGILLYLLRGSSWIVFANSASGGGSLASVNQFVYYGLLSTAIGFALVALFNAWQLVRAVRKRAA
jgi:hypothetical protein